MWPSLCKYAAPKRSALMPTPLSHAGIYQGKEGYEHGNADYMASNCLEPLRPDHEMRWAEKIAFGVHQKLSASWLSEVAWESGPLSRQFHSHSVLSQVLGTHRFRLHEHHTPAAERSACRWHLQDQACTVRASLVGYPETGNCEHLICRKWTVDAPALILAAVRRHQRR